VLVLVAAIATSVSGHALWGSTGHQLTGQICMGLLTPTARSVVDMQIADNTSLPDLSTLADSYRSKAPWSSAWHYVNLPSDARNFTISPACDEAGCVVTAILNYTLRLIEETPKANSCVWTTSQEPCTLAWLTHFIGDVHQPLHVGFKSDKGGNDVTVWYFGSKKNLHSTWDSSIFSRFLQDHDLSSDEFGDLVIAEMLSNPSVRSHIESELSPSLWANTSYRLVREQAYNFFPGSMPANWGGDGESTRIGALVERVVTKRWASLEEERRLEIEEAKKMREREEILGVAGDTKECGAWIEQPYQDRTAPVVAERLVQAGVRMSAYYNCIYDPDFSGPCDTLPLMARKMLAAKKRSHRGELFHQ